MSLQWDLATRVYVKVDAMWRRRGKMTPSIKIDLSGNLGERHRRLNALVNEAFQKNTRFASIQHLPEESATERLFKIDLASKHRNVDYILQTLKNDDMLYVSRALKCLWLFEPKYSSIINPNFLEKDLVPQMTLQAANKLRHWIQKNLKDSQRCCEFYQFYKARDFDVAVKFLWHCPNEYKLCEIVEILEKLTPKHLKILSEKTPHATKIFFANLEHNPTLVKYYLENDLKFFANVKFLLKTDADVFFYVVENFFVIKKFPSFSAEITKYILRHYKSRFMAKPELYAAWLLDMKSLAQCLNTEEGKYLVIKLAKAKFLSSWFSYKNVEPLIKSLSVEERTTFRNLVFVDKAFEESTVKEWPYPIPASPRLKKSQTVMLLEDPDIKPECHSSAVLCAGYEYGHRFPTALDQLFDKYRFTSFKQTMIELRKELRAESSPQSRQNMLLVLVSKTGGRAEDLASLLELLSQYKNEPVNMRAAIVRSLVKRAFAWRLVPEQWDIFFEFGHGLGFNGIGILPESTSSSSISSADFEDLTNTELLKLIKMNLGEDLDKLQEIVEKLKKDKLPKKNKINCDEGLHAVIIRDLLANLTPDEAVWKAFLDKFSSLAVYSLSPAERKCIRTRLPTLLLADAKSSPETAPDRLNLLLDTLSAYQVRYDEFPEVIEVISALAKTDFESAKPLLTRLYKARVARKTLIREFIEIFTNDAMYLNALRHNISILENMEGFQGLIAKKRLKHDQFLRKLAIFFSEKDGMAEKYRSVLELRANIMPDKILARPLAILAGSTFSSLLKKFDTAGPKTPQRQLAACLRSNALVVRPCFDLESLGWRAAGAKVASNRISNCRQTDVEHNILNALSWNRTLRLALLLAARANKECEVYEVFAAKRPGGALKAALKYFRREGDKADPRIWHIVKHHISVLDRQRKRCHYSITNTKYIPAIIKAEYCVIVYKACKRSSDKKAMSILYQIDTMLHDIVEVEIILEEIEYFLNDVFTDEMVLRRNKQDRSCCTVFVDIIAKLLLLSTSKEVLDKRFARIGNPFFKRVEHMWNKFSNDPSTLKNIESDFLDSFISSLWYNKAFFHPKYKACATVFEKIIEWMHSCLPIEKWFSTYTKVHITTLYLKSARFCLTKNPELFEDESSKLKGVEILGNIYGKFIATDVEALAKYCSPSVAVFFATEFYCRLLKYRFSSKYDTSVENFAKATLCGILSTNQSASVYILARHIHQYPGIKSEEDGVTNIMKSFMDSEDMELRFRAQVEYEGR